MQLRAAESPLVRAAPDRRCRHRALVISGSSSMRLELTVEQRERQSNAAAFAQERVAPQAARIDESGEFPATLIADAAKRGYLGLRVPQEFGGSLVDHVSYALTVEAVARASATVA